MQVGNLCVSWAGWISLNDMMKDTVVLTVLANTMKQGQIQLQNTAGFHDWVIPVSLKCHT